MTDEVCSVMQDGSLSQSPGAATEGHPARRNIRTIVELEQKTRARRTRVERIVDAIASWAASPSFILLHGVVFTFWLTWNMNRGRAFDPFPFSLLTVCVSVEAILLTGFVLMQQASMQAEADRRAHLDLQVNLIAEQELTAILRVVCQMAERAGVDLARCGADLEFLLAPTDLEKITETLEHELDDKEEPADKE
jgi:uncharacterized membrane protein